MKFKNQIFTALFATSLVVGCANGDDYGTPDLNAGCIEATATTSVAAISAASTPAMQQFTADDVIEAYVTSSDEGGNFYKSISFVSTDNQNGFSIPVDNYNLYTQFRPGQRVYVKLKDLYNQTNSTRARGLQIGANYQGEVGRLSTIAYRSHIVRACEGSVAEDNIVKHLTVTQAKNDNYLNQLIEFDAVQFSEASLGNNYFSAAMNPVPTWTATNHLIEDGTGKTIIVRISQFSNFANKKVAEGSGKIRGVLTKYNGDYQFMVRTINDIQLTEERFEIDNGIPSGPGVNAVGLFNGYNFENFSEFTSILTLPLQHATASANTGVNGGNALAISLTTPGTNDFVFTAKGNGNLPATYSKIGFYVKGTSAKSLSFNILAVGGNKYYNVGNLTQNAVIAASANNQYTGTINTNNQWVYVTLDITDVNLPRTSGSPLIALKIGSNSAYNLLLDHFTIE